MVVIAIQWFGGSVSELELYLYSVHIRPGSQLEPRNDYHLVMTNIAMEAMAYRNR